MLIIRFIEPMLLLQTDKLPEGAAWLHEVKLDGYRAIAGRSGNSILFRSRRDNDFTRKFPSIAKAFGSLPDETLVDGEVAALSSTQKTVLQSPPELPIRSGPLVYFVFDLLMFKGESLLNKPLDERKAILEQQIVPKLQEPLRYMEPIEGRMEDLIRAVREHGLEGLVAKRRRRSTSPALRLLPAEDAG